MSALERRLQLLLDQERYDRLAARAQSQNCSVAAVIREAIDQLFAGHDVDDQAAYAAESDPERMRV